MSCHNCCNWPWFKTANGMKKMFPKIGALQIFTLRAGIVERVSRWRLLPFSQMDGRFCRGQARIVYKQLKLFDWWLNVYIWARQKCFTSNVWVLIWICCLFWQEIWTFNDLGTGKKKKVNRGCVIFITTFKYIHWIFLRQVRHLEGHFTLSFNCLYLHNYCNVFHTLIS